MTTLTLIYAADSAGNFTDPKTGKCWNIPGDRAFFRSKIASEIIICGRKTFEQDLNDLLGARGCVVLTTDTDGVYSSWRKNDEYRSSFLRLETTISGVLDLSTYFSRADRPNEVFCVGGKQTLEAFAPFASRVLAAHIGTDESIWLPGHIAAECRVPTPQFDVRGSLWHTPDGEGFYGMYCEPYEGDYITLDIRRDTSIKF